MHYDDARRDYFEEEKKQNERERECQKKNDKLYYSHKHWHFYMVERTIISFCRHY